MKSSTFLVPTFILDAVEPFHKARKVRKESIAASRMVKAVDDPAIEAKRKEIQARRRRNQIKKSAWMKKFGGKKKG